MLLDNAGKKHWFFAFLFLMVILFSLPADAGKISKVGEVIKLEGRAQIFHRGSRTPVQITVGMDVMQHDTIKTPPGGKVRIQLLDGTQFSVAPDAKLQIDEFVYDPARKTRSGKIDIAWGKVKFVVSKITGYRQQKFVVTTNTAIVGVRGTDFLVWARAKTQTLVLGLKDVVDVSNRKDEKKQIKLDEGFITDVIADKAPDLPKEVAKEMFKRLFKDLFKDDILPYQDLLDRLTSGEKVKPYKDAAKAGTESATGAKEIASAAVETAETASAAVTEAASAAASKAAVAAAAAAAAAATAYEVASSAVSSATSGSSAESQSTENKKEDADKKESGEPSESTPPETGESASKTAESTPETAASGAKPAGTPAAPAQPVSPETSPDASPVITSKADATPAALTAPLVLLRETSKVFDNQQSLDAAGRRISRMFEELKEKYPSRFQHRFFDNGDGTVTDRVTGLMWQKDLSKENASSYALTYALRQNEIQLGGKTDWRLPTVEETIFLYLSTERGQGLPMTMPEINKGIWTADRTPVAVGFGYSNAYVRFYDGIFSDDVEWKMPTSSGYESRHYVKAVRTIK